MLLSRLCPSLALNLHIFSLIPVIGLTITTWTLEVTIAPQIVRAYTDAVNITLERDAEEPYDGLAQRAEMAARAAAQQSFDRDILVTEVEVTVLGQNGLAVVPILTLSVSRNDWRDRPDPRYWSTYFGASKMLLELN